MMSSVDPHQNVVYVAVPMKDESAPSAPAIFVPSSSREQNVPSRRNISKSLTRAAIILFLGFAIVTILWVMMPMPCHRSMMRGAHHMHQHGMHPGGNHEMHDMMHSGKQKMDHGMMGSQVHKMGHSGDYGMMHEMMGSQGHGMGHHKSPGDHVMMHDMMTNPKNEGMRRWKDQESSSSSQDSIDGWYAGNESHVGWHASLIDEGREESSIDSSSVDSSEEHAINNMHLEAVERVEIEKEDGMIPGLP